MKIFIWVGLIILFALLEAATVGLTSIWFSGGAFAALLSCAAGLGGVGQFVVFAAVSLVLLIFTRPWALKYLKPHLIKTNYEQVISENVCVTEDIDNLRGTGAVVYQGEEWTARAYEHDKTFEKGMIVTVKEIRGVTLYVVSSSIMPEKVDVSGSK